MKPFVLILMIFIISELLKPTSTISTPPKSIESKPRKPTYKEKPKKFKQPRRKETIENKYEEHELSTSTLPEFHDIFPTFTTIPSTSRTWIVVHSSSSMKEFLNESRSILVLVIIYGIYNLFFNSFVLYF